jgi:hypothetical protein
MSVRFINPFKLMCMTKAFELEAEVRNMITDSRIQNILCISHRLMRIRMYICR